MAECPTGAVVAREYRICAVVGVLHVTERITICQVFVVDGATGTAESQASALKGI